MDLLIIIIFIIIILASMISAYIPYDLQALAGKAGFSKFSLRYLILKIQKVPIKYLFEQYEKLENENVSIEFEELKKFWLSNPTEIDILIDILIKSEKNQVKIDYNDIEFYNLSEKNASRFYSILNKLSEIKVDFPREKIKKLTHSDINIDSYFEIYNNAKNSGVNINDSDFESNELQIVQNYLDAYIKASNSDIIKDEMFINEKGISLSEKTNFLNNLIYVHDSGIDIPADELKSLHKTDINISDYIKAIKICNKYKLKNISKEEIKQHFLKGGNSLSVLNAYDYAMQHDVELPKEILFEIDLLKDADLNTLIKKMVVIHDLEVYPYVKVILKDGLQVSPRIIVSVRENINSYNIISKEEIIFRQINDLASVELSSFNTHKAIIKNLVGIAENIKGHLLKDKKLARIYNITDIKIKDIEINADTLAGVKEVEAKEKEAEAKLELIKAKTKLQEDMAEALKNGDLSLKDYQREKLIFDSSEDTDLPYHNNK